MAQVSLQVGAAGAYSATAAHHAEVRLNQTANAVALSATDDLGAAITADGDDEAFVYLLSHNGTAGSLTIELFHCETFGGTYRHVNEDALMKLGENSTVPTGSLVLDVSLAANQGTIIVAVCAGARETSGGAFVANLLKNHRLAYTTDASWNGTSIDEVGLGMHYHHQPSGDAS